MSYAPLPTVAQTRFTREQIAAQDLEIAALEVQMTLLRARLDTVRHERAVDEAFIAPMRRLSCDVLAEIIVICATATGASPQVLRTLSSVCRKWRDATLATPRAWSRVLLSFPRSNAPAFPRTFLQTPRDMQEWFSRGASTLKDITIIPTWDHDLREARQAILELFFLHASEAKSLSLNVHKCGGAARFYERLFAVPMPQLSVIDIDDMTRVFWRPHGHESHDGLDDIYRFLEGLPSLHGLITWHLPTRLPQSVRERLTWLYVRDADPCTLLRCFRAHGGFPALRGLRMLNDAWKPKSRPGEEDIHVQSSLDILRIAARPAIASLFFKHLRVPRLSRLTLSIVWSGSVDAVVARDLLETLISASAPPLVDLYLHNLPIEDLDLVTIMRSLPLLQCLVLLDSALTGTAVEVLATPPSASSEHWLCPRLKQICIATELASVKTPISRSAMEDLASVRRSELNVPVHVAYLAVIRLENAQLNEGESNGTWRWDTLPPEQSFTYPDLPTWQQTYMGEVMCETAWSQMESLLL